MQERLDNFDGSKEEELQEFSQSIDKAFKIVDDGFEAMNVVLRKLSKLHGSYYSRSEIIIIHNPSFLERFMSWFKRDKK